MQAGLRAPAVDEEADGDEHRSRHHQRHAELAAADAVVLGFEALVDAVCGEGGDLRADEEADAEGDVVEAADADALVVGRAGPESREGGQDEVHDAVDVADVEGEDLHDGLREEEAEGALEGGAEVLAELAVGGVELGVEVFVAGLLDQLDLFAAQDLGGVSLV